MRSADAIIVGGGIIGLSLALELRRSGLSVMVIEKGEPGREASHAAAGMLAPTGEHSEPALAELAQASMRIYPEFVAEVEAESGIRATSTGPRYPPAYWTDEGLTDVVSLAPGRAVAVGVRGVALQLGPK